MENKKFLSYMALSLALIMLISVIYFFARPKAKNVEAYKIDKGTYYTGPMIDNKFDGKGLLKSDKGTYQGSFKNGRFDGAGSFTVMILLTRLIFLRIREIQRLKST